MASTAKQRKLELKAFRRLKKNLAHQLVHAVAKGNNKAIKLILDTGVLLSNQDFDETDFPVLVESFESSHVSMNLIKRTIRRIVNVKAKNDDIGHESDTIYWCMLPNIITSIA